MLLGLLVACDFAADIASPPDIGVEVRPDTGFGRGDTAAPDTADSGDSSGDSGDSGDTADTADTGGPRAQWTVLVFVNGDNDLERWALGDVNEMESVGSTDDVNVVVQLDRSPEGFPGDGDWSGARRYRVEADADPTHITSPVLADLGDVDSGDPSTIEDFVRWGVANYPAEHTMLVLWDHGDGWAAAPGAPQSKAISYDDSAGTSLSVAGGDLTTVVHDAATTLGRPLDVIGFDACEMGQWEVATTVAADADVMVASEDLEDVDGWPYDAVLTDLTSFPTMTPAELGASVALRFHEQPDSTMAVLDLTALSALDAALDAVADRVISTGVAGPLLAAAASGAQGWEGSASREHDLLDLLERMGGYTDDAELGTALAGATAAAEAVIVVSYNVGGAVKDSRGLAIWSPADGAMPALYAAAPWSAASRWDDMVAAAGTP